LKNLTKIKDKLFFKVYKKYWNLLFFNSKQATL
jgi:hypothetical protein